MEKKEHTGLCRDNISLSAGIQFGHAKDEYNIAYGQDDVFGLAKQLETYVILNGGTSNLLVTKSLVIMHWLNGKYE